MLRRRLLRRIAYLRRNRCSALMVALFVFILVHPLLAESAIGGTFLVFGTVGILLLGLWALHARRPHAPDRRHPGAAHLPRRCGRPAGCEPGLRPATPLVTAAFMGAIAAALLYYVLDWHPITTDKVFGAVGGDALIAFTFACVFGLLQEVQPGAFHAAPVHAPNQLDWPAMMYFSFTVLTSTGFERDHPGHRDGARPDRD